MPVIPRLPRLWIGIDPGKQGGLAWISSQGIVDCRRMPETKLELWNVFRIFNESFGDHEAYCFIEDVHAMPKQGVVSMFSFGRNIGRLEAYLLAANIRNEPVTPQRWMKGLSIPTRKGAALEKNQWKNFLRERAQELFPKLPIWKKPHTLEDMKAVADALLIAEFCRRSNP